MNCHPMVPAENTHCLCERGSGHFTLMGLSLSFGRDSGDSATVQEVP